jgi:predicted MFS family arabinose efflux permease
VQSILIRLPRVIGAPLGGLLIVGAGMAGGIRLSLVITIGLALIVLIVQFVGLRDDGPSRGGGADASLRAIVAGMPRSLTRLLAAECFVRIGEAVAASFIILYVTQERGLSAAEYGVLYAIQQSVAIASYFPGGRMADLSGRRPIVALTFVFFAIFPLAVRYASTFGWLAAAFVVGGLKEVGEPARKSLIVDLSPDDRRARTVGVYYTIRNLLVVPAGALGGLLWQRAPHLPLEAACAVGAVGVIVFLMTPHEQAPDVR